MNIIKFKVQHQIMTLVTRDKIVADSQDYLWAQFIFSDDWDDVGKVAQFKRGELFFSMALDENGMCKIPWEILVDEGTFEVSAFGNNLANDSNQIITTHPLEIRILKSGLVPGELPDEPTPGTEGQYLALILQAEANAAASERAAADSVELAKQWATKTDGTVAGGEYSAKHYALQTIAYAEAAETSKSDASVFATNASNSATAAGVSKDAAAVSAVLAENWANKEDVPVSGGKYSAKYYAEQAAGYADDAEDSKDAAAVSEANAAVQANAAATAKAGTDTAALQAAALLQETRAYIASSTIDALWDATTTYHMGDCVMTPEGSTYRCLQTSTNNPPASSGAYWTPISLVAGDTFEYDENGDLMPRATLTASPLWAIDENGDVMPAA